MRLTFLGATRQVTGSQYHLGSGDTEIVVDCGMYQERPFVDRNWQDPRVDVKRLTALVLTHAHLDHCGMIPRLVARGFSGPIHCTEPTADLAEIILRDSAYIQAEDAAYKKRRHRKEGRTPKHAPTALYDEKDVERAISQFEPIEYGQRLPIGNSAVTFHEAGHILGASVVEMEVGTNGQSRRLLFSGDLGQRDKPLLRDPAIFDSADYVVMESTYGDRNHPAHGDIQTQLATTLRETIERGGNVVIPVFAVERAQEMIYYLSQLIHDKQIPRVPVFLDSPMAINVTDLFRRYRKWLDAETWDHILSGESPFQFPGLTMSRTAAQSKEINGVDGPAIIMATSGMCTAGRIKFHLRHNIARPESTIVFVGFQVRGTLGRLILEGTSPVRIHGRQYDVKARIEQIHGFSGHTDRNGLTRWLGNLKQPPRRVFLTHGEEDASLSLANHLRNKLDWPIHVPEYRESVELE